MRNSVFGKNMENLRSQGGIKPVITDQKKEISRFQSLNIIQQNTFRKTAGN